MFAGIGTFRLTNGLDDRENADATTNVDSTVMESNKQILHPPRGQAVAFISGNLLTTSRHQVTMTDKDDRLISMIVHPARGNQCVKRTRPPGPRWLVNGLTFIRSRAHPLPRICVFD